MPIDALRTPDDRFENLPDFPYPPSYLDALPGYEGLRMHYVDVGPEDADVSFLCLHGEPSWSFLYRKMIPIFAAGGHRVVAPDFFGFGRSDKPVHDDVYTFHFHRNAIKAFFDAMELRNVCLVVQDWGGLLGLTLPMDYPERITRLIVMNTALAVGQPAGQGFNDWKAFVKANPDLDVAALMKRAIPGADDATAAAYGAPFPDAGFKAGVRRFPEMVMVAPEMEGVAESRAAAEFLGTQWDRPTFMAIGMQDPVLGPPVMQRLRAVIRGCPEPLEVPEGGHFVQEHGEGIARAALSHFGL